MKTISAIKRARSQEELSRERAFSVVMQNLFRNAKTDRDYKL